MARLLRPYPAWVRRPSVIFIFTVTLTGILNNNLVAPAIPDILAEFGEPARRSGLLVSLGSVAGIVVAPTVGLVADRVGRRPVLTACLIIFGAFGFGAALAPSFELLLAARFFQGFGSAGLINLAVALIGDYWSGTERTRIVGHNSAVLTVGLALLPLAAGFTTELFGWRTTFMFYTVAFGTAAWAWMTLDRRKPPRVPGLTEQLRGAAAAVRRPVPAATIATTFLVFMTIFGGVLTVMPVHLADRFALNAAERGFYLALPAFTSSLVAFNLARIRARWAPGVIVTFAAGLWVVAFLALGSAASLGLVATGALIFGLGEGSLVPTLQDVNVASAPDSQRGAVVAIWVGLARLGQTVGPLLGGLGIALVGTGPALTLAAGLALAVAAVGWFGPFRTLGRQPG